MPDDETTQPSPGRQPGTAPEQVTGPDAQTDPDPGLLTDAGQATEQAGEPETDPAARGTGGTRGRGAWAAVAAPCVVLGAIASVLGAQAVARNDTSSTRTTFEQSSKAIATTVKLTIQRQEELTVAASTYFAANPKATLAEFGRWVTWARTQRRYPELDALGLLPAPPLPGKTSAASGKASAVSATNASGASSNASDASNSATVASGAASATSTKASPPAVHVSPAQLLSRDTGLSIYRQISAGHRQALAIQTPVYRGNVIPHTVFGRTAASVGWLREVLVPGAMLGQVLTGHPGYALAVTYRNGTSNLVYSSGVPRSGAESANSNLHDGWTVTSFGPAPAASVFSDTKALAVLIGGIL